MGDVVIQPTREGGKIPGFKSREKVGSKHLLFEQVSRNVECSLLGLQRKGSERDKRNLGGQGSRKRGEKGRTAENILNKQKMRNRLVGSNVGRKITRALKKSNSYYGTSQLQNKKPLVSKETKKRRVERQTSMQTDRKKALVRA